ncbi:hypothetical protein MSHv_05920 [Mycoplasmopsis synoviae]|nr:hypothetical protein MSHv_05920 [Mycoplasmopsis synoviae]AQU48389.1 hypothetical protein ADF19_05920 [Mycoplasmopsis synoviae]
MLKTFCSQRKKIIQKAKVAFLFLILPSFMLKYFKFIFSKVLWIRKRKA